MSKGMLPKISIEAADYEGLQRDHRANLKDLDSYKTVCESPEDFEYYKPPLAIYEPHTTYVRHTELPAVQSTTQTPRIKHVAWVPRPPDSAGIEPPRTSISPVDLIENDNSRGRKGRTYAGLEPAVFFAALAIVLLLIIGGVVGGVLGAKILRQDRTQQTASMAPAASSTTGPSPTPVPLLNDPQPGTPFSTFSFSQDGQSASPDQQNHRLYYQQMSGPIQELRYDGALSGWQESHPIFTDARNYSGLATFTWLNGTNQWGHIFYVNADNIIQEKRSWPKQPVWDMAPGYLGDSNIVLNGSSATANDNGALRMAAVYSADFSTGPGGRVFYHAMDGSNIPYVQEVVWDQQTNAWTGGQRIDGPAPNSQLSATVDGAALRLFYCSGGGTLQESYLTLSHANGSYTQGFSKAGVLARDDGPIAAVTVMNSTLIYYTDAQLTIHELNVTNITATSSVTLNPSIVAMAGQQPLLSLGAAFGPYEPLIHVMYSDMLGSTVGEIVDVQRPPIYPQWSTNASISYLPLDSSPT